MIKRSLPTGQSERGARCNQPRRRGFAQNATVAEKAQRRRGCSCRRRQARHRRPRSARRFARHQPDNATDHRDGRRLQRADSGRSEPDRLLWPRIAGLGYRRRQGALAKHAGRAANDVAQSATSSRGTQGRNQSRAQFRYDGRARPVREEHDASCGAVARRSGSIGKRLRRVNTARYNEKPRSILGRGFSFKLAFTDRRDTYKINILFNISTCL